LAQNAPQNAISGEAALKRIMDGNARYMANMPEQKDFSAGRAARAQSQHPIAAILSCADSRVAPEFAFDQGPGDLFVVRVAGNFVNDDGLASLEFGTQFLGAPLIMVLGHTSCGAIAAAIRVVNEGLQLPGHLPEMINAIKPAVEEAKKENPGDLLAAATVANVRLNVERLKKANPILSSRAAENKLLVVGGVYNLATGKIDLV
jgi:carbonic anhydrase